MTEGSHKYTHFFFSCGCDCKKKFKKIKITSRTTSGRERVRSNLLSDFDLFKCFETLLDFRVEITGGVSEGSILFRIKLKEMLDNEELIKNAGLHRPLFSEPCHHWHTTSQSRGQLIGFTQNLGWRKSHAGSKIDLGLYSEGKMKGIQSYHSPSRVSLQQPQYFPCVFLRSLRLRNFSTCDQHQVQGATRGWIRSAANIFTALESMFRLIRRWRRQKARGKWCK